MRAVDADQDGRTDLLICGHSPTPGECWLWLRTSEQGFDPGVVAFSTPSGKGSILTPLPGDFNCDGATDLAGFHWDGRGRLRVWLGGGQGLFPRHVDTDWDSGPGAWPRFPPADGVADLDGDGNLDLFGFHEAAPMSAGDVSCMLGSVVGRFHSAVLLEGENAGYGWIGAAAGDLNGDGVDELIVRRNGWVPDKAAEPNLIAVFRVFAGGYSMSQAIFEEVSPALVGSESALRVGHLTCPGRVDVVTGDRALLRTDASGKLGAPIELAFGRPTKFDAVADLTGDGLDDLVSCSGTNVTVWINETPQ